MSLKLHILAEDVSDEHGERFHQDIASMEKIQKKMNPYYAD